MKDILLTGPGERLAEVDVVVASAIDPLIALLAEHPDDALMLVLAGCFIYVVKTAVPKAVSLAVAHMSEQRELDREERRKDREDVKENIGRICASYDRIATKVEILAERIVQLVELTRRGQHGSNYNEFVDRGTTRP